MKNLKDYRTAKNLSQEEVARTVEITLRQYQNIEKGTSIPNAKVALRICRLLECDIYTVTEWNQ